MSRRYFYATVRWIGTFMATGGIVLLQTLLFVGSLFVKEYNYSEFDWRIFVICVVLTIAGVFAARRLMKAKFYVTPLGNAVFRLYAVVSVVLSPSIIRLATVRFSTDMIQKCNDLTAEIICSALIIIEFVVVPMLLCIFTFKKRHLAVKKGESKTGESYHRRNDEERLTDIH